MPSFVCCLRTYRTSTSEHKEWNYLLCIFDKLVFQAVRVVGMNGATACSWEASLARMVLASPQEPGCDS